jgi:hypothetical protein
VRQNAPSVLGTISARKSKPQQHRKMKHLEEDMAPNSKKPLKPDDFPVDADGQRIKKHNGTPLADAESPAAAAEIVERLNEDEAKREEEKWSA